MSVKDSKKQAKRKAKKKKHEDFLFKTYNKYGKLQLKQELPHGAKYIQGILDSDRENRQNSN